MQIPEIPAQWWPMLLILIAGAVVALLIVILGIWWIVRASGQRRVVRPAPPGPQSIDVVSLNVPPPEAQGAQLEVYGVPVQLAVIVVAPKGRLSDAPDEQRLKALLERITPRLSQICQTHQPRVDRWPTQLSIEGFRNAFAHHVRLPTGGAGSAWCAVVGPISSPQDKVLVGIVGRAAAPHQIGTVLVQQEGLWRDVLRVRAS